jgi:hypothetical protein
MHTDGPLDGWATPAFVPECRWQAPPLSRASSGADRAAAPGSANAVAPLVARESGSEPGGRTTLKAKAGALAVTPGRRRESAAASASIGAPPCGRRRELANVAPVWGSQQDGLAFRDDACRSTASTACTNLAMSGGRWTDRTSPALVAARDVLRGAGWAPQKVQRVVSCQSPITLPAGSRKVATMSGPSGKGLVTISPPWARIRSILSLIWST